MRISNAIEPTEAQLAAFLARDGDGPVNMVNLLKFREKATYPDGRDADMSGAEAYMRYGGPVTRLVEQAGGTLKFSALPSAFLVGEAEEAWEMVAIMTYPSSQTLPNLAMTPEYQALALHRKAGLAGQLLIPCFAKDTFVG